MSEELLKKIEVNEEKFVEMLKTVVAHSDPSIIRDLVNTILKNCVMYTENIFTKVFLSFKMGQKYVFGLRNLTGKNWKDDIAQIAFIRSLMDYPDSFFYRQFKDFIMRTDSNIYTSQIWKMTKDNFTFFKISIDDVILTDETFKFPQEATALIKLSEMSKSFDTSTFALYLKTNQNVARAYLHYFSEWGMIKGTIDDSWIRLSEVETTPRLDDTFAKELKMLEEASKDVEKKMAEEKSKILIKKAQEKEAENIAKSLSLSYFPPLAEEKSYKMNVKTPNLTISSGVFESEADLIDKINAKFNSLNLPYSYHELPLSLRPDSKEELKNVLENDLKFKYMIENLKQFSISKIESTDDESIIHRSSFVYHETKVELAGSLTKINEILQKYGIKSVIISTNSFHKITASASIDSYVLFSADGYSTDSAREALEKEAKKGIMVYLHEILGKSARFLHQSLKNNILEKELKFNLKETSINNLKGLILVEPKSNGETFASSTDCVARSNVFDIKTLENLAKRSGNLVILWDIQADGCYEIGSDIKKILNLHRSCTVRQFIEIFGWFNEAKEDKFIVHFGLLLILIMCQFDYGIKSILSQRKWEMSLSSGNLVQRLGAGIFNGKRDHPESAQLGRDLFLRNWKKITKNASEIQNLLHIYNSARLRFSSLLSNDETMDDYSGFLILNAYKAKGKEVPEDFKIIERNFF